MRRVGWIQQSPHTKGYFVAVQRYRVDRTRSLSERTELRVHGVGASPPEKILDLDFPVLVAGDGTAGFYRGPSESDPQLEAYCWGGMTARGTGLRGLRRALWVFLLPFAFINTAWWMIDTDEGKSARGRRVIFALLSFLATVGAAAFLYAVVIESVGANCILRSDVFPEASCASKIGLGWFRDSAAWFVDYPARLVVLSMVPSLAILALLGAVTKRSHRTYAEAVGVPNVDATLPDATPMRVGDPVLWANHSHVAMLRRLHVAGALAVLAVAVASTGDADLDPLLHRGGGWFWAAVATYLVIAGVVAVNGSKRPDADRVAEHSSDRDFAYWLRWIAIAVLIGASVSAISTAQQIPADTLEAEGLFYSRVSSDPTPEGEILNRQVFDAAELEELYGAPLGWYFPALESSVVEPVFTWLFALVGLPAIVLLPLLFLLFLFPPRNMRDGAAGFAPAVVTLVGLLLGTVAVASVHIWAEIFLEAWVTEDFAVIRAITLVLIAATAAIMVLVGVGAWVRAGWRSRDRADGLASEFWGVAGIETPTERSDASWLKKLDIQLRLRWMADWLMFPLAVVAVLSLTLLGLYLFNFDLVIGLLSNELRWLEGLAALVALTFLPGAFLIIWKSQRIGHLWDVLTFWPGWGHPFAPPSYAMRAVPEIANRVTNRLEGPVVLAGHSQGSVLAATVVAGLAPEVRDRVALLTYGSPLVRLYQRTFPDYFGEEEMALLAGSLTSPDASTPRWRNVYRPSDQIAAPILTAAAGEVFAAESVDVGIDVMASDPYPHVGHTPPPGDPMPTIKGHGGYPEDPPYQAAVAKLWELLEPKVIDLRKQRAGDAAKADATTDAPLS